jgi:hypothetical protein
MFYDPIRNAYADAEDGTVVLKEETLNSQQKTHFEETLHFEILAEVLMEVRAHSQLKELQGLERLNNSIKQEKDHCINIPTIALALRSSSSSISSDSNHTDPPYKGASKRIPTNEKEDWIFARALPAMRFHRGDFIDKEYRASRSCRAQLLTISALICLLQVCFVYQNHQLLRFHR